MDRDLKERDAEIREKDKLRKAKKEAEIEKFKANKYKIDIAHYNELKDKKGKEARKIFEEEQNLKERLISCELKLARGAENGMLERLEKSKVAHEYSSKA